MKIVSWNVNGLRAVLKRNFMDFLAEEKPDILCLQEVKAAPEVVSEVNWPDGYQLLWNPAERKGYAGTLTFTRVHPAQYSTGVGNSLGDSEGRAQVMEYDDFFLLNVYTPNAQRDLARLEWKTQEWDEAFRKRLKELTSEKPVVFCGDLNVAHKEIDLANPKNNRKNAGFTPEERDSFSKTLDTGFADIFREQHPEEKGHYSWWSYRFNARARNIGWRIDYVCVAQELRDRVKRSFILKDVEGSDHAPVGIELN